MKRDRTKEEALSQADMKIRALKELDPVAYTKEHDTLGLRNFLGKYKVETLRSWLQFKGITEDAGSVSKMDKETIIRLVNKWVKDKTATFYQKAESVLTKPPANAKLVAVKQRAAKGKKTAGKTFHYFIASGPLRIAGAKGITNVKAGTPVMVGANGGMWTQTMENIKKRFIEERPKREKKRKPEYAAKLKDVDPKQASDEAERLALQFLKPNADKEKIYNAVCAMSTDGIRMFAKAAGKHETKGMSREQLLESILPGREKAVANAGLGFLVGTMIGAAKVIKKNSEALDRMRALAPAFKAMRDKSKPVDKKINDDLRGEMLLDDMAGSPEAEATRIAIAVRKMKRRWPSLLKSGNLAYYGNVTMVNEGQNLRVAGHDHNDTKFFVGSSYLGLTPQEKRILGTMLYQAMESPANRLDSLNALQSHVYGKIFNRLDTISNAIAGVNLKLIKAGASVIIKAVPKYDTITVGLYSNPKMPASKAEPGFPSRQPAPEKKSPAKSKGETVKPAAKKTAVKKSAAKPAAKRAAPKPAPKKSAAKKPVRRKTHASTEPTMRDQLKSLVAVVPRTPIPADQIEVTSRDAGVREVKKSSARATIAQALASVRDVETETANRGAFRLIRQGETIKKVANIVREGRARKAAKRSRKQLVSFLNRKGFRKNIAYSMGRSKKVRIAAKEKGLRWKEYYFAAYDAMRGKLKQELGGVDMRIVFASWKPYVEVTFGKFGTFKADGTNHLEAFNEIIAQIVDKGSKLTKKRQIKVIEWVAKNLDPIKDAEDKAARKELEKRMREAQDEDDDQEAERRARGEAVREAQGDDGDGDGDADADADAMDFASVREKATASIEAIIRGERAEEK